MNASARSEDDEEGEEEEGAAQRVCGTSHFVKHMKSTPCLFIAEGTTAVGTGDR